MRNTNDRKSMVEIHENMEKRTGSLSSWLRLGKIIVQANIANNHEHPLWRGSEKLWKDLNLCQIEPCEMADFQPL